ncbi:MAG: PKD domain-containing protein [Myxococcota bacterium]
MTRSSIHSVLFAASLVLAGCSSGLTALGETDLIPVDPDTDVDTDPGIDTDQPVDTDTTPNTPPVADAGADQSSLTGAVIELDGAGSFDAEGDPLDFLWTMTSSPPGWAGSIINETRSDAQFFADTPGTYAVELTVDDGQYTSSDSVTITIEQPNEVPVANAGSDQYVDQGDTVQLNGSNSYDPDSDPLSYAWTLISKPSNSSASLDDPSSPLPRFTADQAGVYTVELIVTDSSANGSSPDQVRITAQSSGGGGGGGGGGDCLSCVAAQAQHRFATGSAAAVPGFLVLLALPLARRRRK